MTRCSIAAELTGDGRLGRSTIFVGVVGERKSCVCVREGVVGGRRMGQEEEEEAEVEVEMIGVLEELCCLELQQAPAAARAHAPPCASSGRSGDGNSVSRE